MNEQILLGTLLGDAYIQKSKSRNCSYQLKFNQSIEEFALWKAEMLGIKYNYKTKKVFDIRTNKFYNRTDLWFPGSSKSIEYYYNLFYTPKKEVTLKVLTMLDDLALSIWYCDDGSMYYNGNNCHLTLSTNGFNDESRKIIIEWFRSKYNINFKATTQGAIRLTSIKNCKIFMNIVEKHLPECMLYKTLTNNIKKYEEKLTPQQLKLRNGQLSKK